MTGPVSELAVDGDRLWSRLMEMATVGATANGGSNRQALSDEDAAGRRLFLDWAEAAGCRAETDEVGNLWVRRPGADPAAAPVLIGSHLDTQPTGGRFDGVYGVLGGLEVIERLNDLGEATDRPIDLVVWTNEEGSRFQYSMMGSAVWAGKLGLADARALTDVDGLTVGGELDRLGWSGDRPAAPSGHVAAFELHIEQGPILEAEQVEIGVVTGVQGLRWFTIELGGFPAHAGPTPMAGRKDPARAMAELVSGVYEAVEARGEWARATFAQFHSTPVSPNTIPETLTCTLDIRHPDPEVLEAMEQDVRGVIADRCRARGVTHRVERQNDSAPVALCRRADRRGRGGGGRAGPVEPADDLRGRARCLLRGPPLPDGDDLRAVRGGAQPQRGRAHHRRSGRSRGLGAAGRPAPGRLGLSPGPPG